MARSVEVLFGPPGAGKTHTVAQRVEDALKSGISLERIALLSFSRQAVAEILERAGAQDAPWCRTIHSLAYRFLELRREQVVDGRLLSDFAKTLGEPPPMGAAQDEGPWSGNKLARIFRLYDIARARGASLEEEWKRWGGIDIEWWVIRDWVSRYEHWKRQRRLYDFPDMIQEAYGQLPVDLLIVDEAQDTTPASWKFLRRAAGDNTRVILAGDDDQSVYGFAGADGTDLLRFKADRTVLPQSFRLPRRVKLFAERIVQKIQSRYPKLFAPRDAEGEVSTVEDTDDITFNNTDSYLLLGRDRRSLRRWFRLVRTAGIVYMLPNGQWSWSLPSVQAAVMYERLRKGDSITREQYRTVAQYCPEAPRPLDVADRVDWAAVFGGSTFTGLRNRTWMDALNAMGPEDREYLRALRRRGESLSQPGKVRISTIHRAKGAEADHVAVLRRLPGPSRNALRAGGAEADNELRVWYVGATRARETLTWVGHPDSSGVFE